MLPHSKVRAEFFTSTTHFQMSCTHCRMCSTRSPFVASIIGGSINFSFGEPCLNYLDSRLLFLFLWLFAHFKSLIAKLSQSGFQASHSFQCLHTALQTKLLLNISVCFLRMFYRRLGLKLASPVVICLSPGLHSSGVLSFSSTTSIYPDTRFLCPNTTIPLLQ